jgi:hypothetical protein
MYPSKLNQVINFVYCIQSVRTNLITSLLRNVTVPHPGVFRLSIEIFALLTQRLRLKLKTEIQIFFDNIFLRTLQSPNASYEQRSCVLGAVREMLKTPQIIVDFFVNYDCELESVDLLERLVHALSKNALSNHAAENGFTPQQDARIRYLGLENLVLLLQSLYDWVKPKLSSPDTPQAHEHTTTTSDVSVDGGENADEGKPESLLPGKEKKLERAKVITKFNLGMRIRFFFFFGWLVGWLFCYVIHSDFLFCRCERRNQYVD